MCSYDVLAFLLHPATSPFAEHYYNFKAKSQLKQLYDSCKLVWAADGYDNVSPEDAGEQGISTKCSLATAVLSPYDFHMTRMLRLKLMMVLKPDSPQLQNTKKGLER